MKLSNLLLYEPKSFQNFYPFSIMHPIWELRIGAFKIFEKYQFLFPESTLHFHSRSEQLHSFMVRNKYDWKEISKGNLLSIDGTYLPTSEFIGEIEKLIDQNEKSFLLTDGENIFGIYLTEKEVLKSEEFTRKELLSDLNVNLFAKFEKIEIKNIKKLSFLFDALNYVDNQLEEDFKILPQKFQGIQTAQFPYAYLINPENILIGENIKLQPGTVLDASNGPIIIGDNTEIMAHSTVLGPVYIGKNNLIKVGAKIYHSNAFGDWCKVGGEVENSIIQGYSNKQHEGFLGHSFLSEWVNLGADTNTSDLKNTYSNIKIRIENREIDTERMFLGLLCGDHTKSGINTMFTTGTVAGICGILVREWFLPNFIQSFSWGGSKDSPIYKAAKAIDTARIVMKRRGVELTQEEEKLIKMEYERIISKS